MGICYNLEQDKNMVEVPSAENDFKEMKQSQDFDTKIIHSMKFAMVEQSYNIKYVGKLNLNRKNKTDII